MPRILLVKTSSLGDLVHNLPVAGDIAARLPGAEIDWVVEEPFAALPALHPAVSRTLPVAIRRWRGSVLKGETRREVAAAIGRVREREYDAVIDTQGLFKSAFIARLARGRRYGLGWRASREPLFPFYHRTFDVPRALHAVERNRILAGRALDYDVPAGCDYGIRAAGREWPWLPAGGYAVLLHATSAEEKLWPEASWIEVGRGLGERGLRAVLPWGSPVERGRAERLARGIEGAIVPPSLDIAALAALLGGARRVAGVDTGLTHLAGALGVPAVGVYTATDPARTGLYRCPRGINVGGTGAVPSIHAVIDALDRAAA